MSIIEPIQVEYPVQLEIEMGQLDNHICACHIDRNRSTMIFYPIQRSRCYNRQWNEILTLAILCLIVLFCMASMFWLAYTVDQIFVHPGAIYFQQLDNDTAVIRRRVCIWQIDRFLHY